MDRTDLKRRATEVFETANFLSEELARLNAPEPSFEFGLPEILRAETVAATAAAASSKAEVAREKLVQVLDEFRAVLTEPAVLLNEPLGTLNVIVQLGIPDVFPPDGAAVSEIAEKVNTREDIVKRLLAHCATHHIFYQARPGFFVHTAASRMLVYNPEVRIRIRARVTETFPALLSIGDAMRKFPNSEEPQQCGWSVANRNGLSMFDGLATFPERATNFNKSMTMLAKLPGLSLDHLIRHFPFGLENHEHTVVDVGGGFGHVAKALAEHDTNTRCVIQDKADIVDQGREELPISLRGRVTFQAHDFFEDQPIKGAQVYLLRHILHDWSDKYARLILQKLMPALVPGAKIVINDRIIPDMDEAHYLVEREVRNSDIIMLGFFNAKERNLAEWTALFEEADPRFVITKLSTKLEMLSKLPEAKPRDS